MTPPFTGSSIVNVLDGSDFLWPFWRGQVRKVLLRPQWGGIGEVVTVCSLRRTVKTDEVILFLTSSSIEKVPQLFAFRNSSHPK